MAIFFVYFMWIIGFISIMNNKKHDCYVVLKDSEGNIVYIYGYYQGKIDGKAAVIIEGSLRYLPVADVVVFGNLV